MSRLYYKALTNLNPSELKIPTPYIDYIAFDIPAKFRITVSCNGSSDYVIDENRILSGRWKGVEVHIEDYDGNEIHDFDDMNDDDFNLLKLSPPYEIGIYYPLNANYDEDFNISINNLTIEIYHENEKQKFIINDNLNVEEYGD